MIDKEELDYIKSNYKKIKKGELVYAIEWLIDYIEDMKLPSKRELLLKEIIEDKNEAYQMMKKLHLETVDKLNETIKRPLAYFLWNIPLIKRLFG